MPLTAVGQDRSIRKLGYLSYGPGKSADELGPIKAFEHRLEELGWKVGETLIIEYRFPAADIEKMDQYAEELVSHHPDVLVDIGTPETKALMKATHTIPIIFWGNTDPVGSGVVGSLAHPGGNVTGFQGFEYSLAGQWIDLLRKAAPATKRIGFMYNPQTIPFFKQYVDVGRAAAAALGVEFLDQPLLKEDDIEPAVATLSGGSGGLVMPPDSFTTARAQLLASLTLRHSVPAIYAYKFFPQSGGLMSYGNNDTTLVKQAAEYVDRVLRGTSPGDLPVQAPAEYDLVINLRTATALGLTIPPDLLARAAQVIE